MVFCRIRVVWHWFLLGCSYCVATAGDTGRREERLTTDWRFYRGSASGAEAQSFDDSRWDRVRIPHDWAIAGPFDPRGDPETGKLPWRGEGWYRNRFRLSRDDAGKCAFLDFDGAMANPVVWINGQKAGGWDYGYCPFRVDITPLIRAGGWNTVAVHLDTRQVQSRWYPGAGIYRPVRLVICDPIHVTWNGLWVRTTRLEGSNATLSVSVALANRTGTNAPVRVTFEVRDAALQRVVRWEGDTVLSNAHQTEVTAPMQIQGAHRWDVQDPHLYRARATVTRSGHTADVVEVSFGIRDARFDAARGFLLNGRKLSLQGVCLHHDQGALGAAFLPRAMERQLELLKEMGCNAIRTSHNIPAAEVLDLCDRMGVLVYAEAFDKWDDSKVFAGYATRQIRNFVLRDRNHPSVILWGAGNELLQQRLGRGKNLAVPIAAEFKRWDPDRPVALACSVLEWVFASGLDAPFDVGAYNYGKRFVRAHELWPDRPALASETASTLSTRGHYELPPDAHLPTPTRQVSSFDRQTVLWGALPDAEFAAIQDHSFVAGEFVWSGFDYLGEPTPFGSGMSRLRILSPEHTARSSFFGILDLSGLPKDRYYLYQSHWRPEAATVHILPHWTWPGYEGRPIPVYVYTSGDSAELFVNGRSMGRRSKNPKAAEPMDRYRLRWESVTYEAGTVRAVAYRGEAMLGEAAVKTAGPATTLRLVGDRTEITADGEDLLYVIAAALDTGGNLSPHASDVVRFEPSRGVRLIGVCNGDPYSLVSFKSDTLPLFHGKAVAIFQSVEGRTGSIRVVAEAAGLKAGTVTARAIPATDRKE